MLASQAPAHEPHPANPVYVPFSVESIPLPMDPITDPLPSERRVLETQQQMEQMSLRHQKAEAIAQEKKKTGFLGKLEAVTTTLTSKAELELTQAMKSAQSSAIKFVDEQASKRYATAFPDLAAAGEEPLGSYPCHLLGQTASFIGHLVITNRSVCFIGPNRMTFSFPLQSIASIHKAVALPTFVNGHHGLPYVMTIPVPNVVPDAIQVFTNQRHLHVFTNFATALQGALFNDINDAINVMDHAWRARDSSAPVTGTPVAGGVVYDPVLKPH